MERKTIKQEAPWPIERGKCPCIYHTLFWELSCIIFLCVYLSEWERVCVCGGGGEGEGISFFLNYF